MSAPSTKVAAESDDGLDLRKANDVPTTIHQLTTVDGAPVVGVLRRPLGATTVFALMHPRQDVTHHPLIPHLLDSGHAVWTQQSRHPNNDLNLIHEQALLDYAAGQVFLRELGFESVVSLGHSGGATLVAFYCEQAGLSAHDRLTTASSGRSVPLAEATMPEPDAVVFMAPHPGQGALLKRVIDPSVTDESDPLSIEPDLDPFSDRNGFRPAPEPAQYSSEFIEAYRQAQAARVARIDETAASLVAEARRANDAFKRSDDPRDRRAALAARVLVVHRTDADLRNVDLTLDPNNRPYGSLFGRRPDLANSGLLGFGRICTPEAWMSTWSATTTRADFARCAPAVSIPTLLIEFTGDQASFPADISRFARLLGASDLTVVAVDGTHFGGPLTKGAPTGTRLAAERIRAWSSERI